MSISIREELLSDFGINLSAESYERALLSADESSLALVEYLIEEEVISKEVGCRLWSRRINTAYVDPLSTMISEGALAAVPHEIARKGNLIPLYQVEDSLTIAMPFGPSLIESVTVSLSGSTYVIGYT